MPLVEQVVQVAEELVEPALVHRKCAAMCCDLFDVIQACHRPVAFKASQQRAR